MSKFKKYFYIFLPIILGSIVGFIIKDYIDYQYINKPLFAPPKILFPIVWSIIYLLLGISYYLFKRDNGVSKFYYVQLFFNYLWSILFFVFKFRKLSIFWIIALLIFLILMLIEFRKVNKTSFRLNILYLVWTVFATYLTIGIYVLN